MENPSKTKKTNQALGTIYRCLNTITGKSYIGQTRQSLETRIKGHYSQSKRKNSNTKFARALRKYDRQFWEWSTLKEVPVEQIDEEEKKCIAEFGACKYGYNTLTGREYTIMPETRQTTKGLNQNIYNFYHCDYGEVSCTIWELIKNYNLPHHTGINQVIHKTRPRYKGWILAEFKDDYDKAIHLHEFWHPIHGYIKCTPADLTRNYNVCHASISHLFSGRSIRAKNWYLFENKHLFKKIYKE
jgi:hypothetical protein